MELNRMKGEVSEELRLSFEGWTMTTRLRQHASADCFYRPDGRRTRILAALPREFTYAELKRVIKSHGGSKMDERIMATHLNHQTILAVGQRRIPDKRLRFGPPPAVTPPKRRRTAAPEPVDDDDRTEDYAGPPVDVSEQELDAAKAKAAALNAAAAQAVAAAAQAVADLAQADAELATKKRQRRETIDRQIERLQAARDALESDVYVQPQAPPPPPVVQPPPPPPLQQPPAPPPLAPPPAPSPYYVL